MHLFELAARHRTWLAERQTTVAQNIANANTPGYRARAVASFESLLTDLPMAQSTTHSAHVAGAVTKTVLEVEAAEPDRSTHSGNSVDIERELITAGDVNRGYALNAGVTKAFHRLLMAALRT